MDKQRYLESLRHELRELPQSTVDEVLSDYAEHFDSALSAGKTEAEVAAKLGLPKRIATMYLTDVYARQMLNASSTSLRVRRAFALLTLVAGLGAVNALVFAAPFGLALLLLLSLWLVPATIATTAIFAFLSVAQIGSATLGVAFSVGSICLGLGCLFAAVAIALLLVQSTYWFSVVAAQYAAFNLKTVQEGLRK